MDFENNLLILNARGIFPGPGEGPQSFLSRAEHKVSSAESKAFALTKELFDAVPDWVEVHIGSKGLLPWEGAATWIEESADGKRTSAIQLRGSLPTMLYLPEEVLAHELVHAMRLNFNEDRFEEILAYQTSKNRFRRYFGPLFSRPAEIKGLIALIATAWVVYWSEFVFDVDFGGSFLIFSPFIVLGLLVFRLARAQRIFAAALKNLKKAVANSGKPLAVALRLTDAEVALFARISAQEIIDYATGKKETSLRWRQIFHAYF